MFVAISDHDLDVVIFSYLNRGLGTRALPHQARIFKLMHCALP